MKINRENYEEWMIDFIEGNLSPGDEEEVRDFLDHNPDLKEEVEEFEDTVLVPEGALSFNEKVFLKKGATGIEGMNRNEYLLINKTENILTITEKKEYDTLLKTDSDALKEQTLFDKTVLKPDTGIVYPYKNKLKRVTLIPYLNRETFNRVAAVAVLILLISISWFTLKQGPARPEKDFAEVQGQTANRAGSQIAEQQSPARGNVEQQDKQKEDRSMPVEVKVEREKNIRGKSVSETLKKSVPVPEMLASKGVDDMLKPVELNGYEIALDQIMPLYISCLRNRTEGPPVMPAPENEQNMANKDLLAGGVKVINKLTGNFFNIHKKYDNNGDVVAYTFATPNLRIDHKVKKGE